MAYSRQGCTQQTTAHRPYLDVDRHEGEADEHGAERLEDSAGADQAQQPGHHQLADQIHRLCEVGLGLEVA